MLRTALFLLLFFLSWSPCHAAYPELKAFPFGTNSLLRDDHRDRIYCTVPASNSIAIIDSKKLTVLATIFTGSNPSAIAESPDGANLYVANSGSTSQGVAVVDLERLTVSRYIATTGGATSLAANSTTLYTIENYGGYGGDGFMQAYKISDGSLLPGFIDTYHGGVFIYGGNLAISPDGGTLYYYQTGLSPSFWFRLSTATWPVTTLQTDEFGGNGQGMALSADGQWITFVSGSPYYVSKLSASDPNQVAGTFNTGPYPQAATYSPDGSTLFTNHTDGQVEVWNTNTYLQAGIIPTAGVPYHLVCDRKGALLFTGTDDSVRAYQLTAPASDEPLKMTVKPAVEISWNSTAGRFYQIEQRSLFGGKAAWEPLGEQVVGTGGTVSVFDTYQNSRFKRYRVVPATH